jgi:hypothetical protein
MGYSTNSGPFWVGTLVFIILGVAGCFISGVMAKAGRNQYLGLSYVMVTMAAICMWMLWGMAWLMQWHPLIFPIRDIPGTN